jgi:ABC-type antimicrobial peptide transport system permease subunit
VKAETLPLGADRLGRDVLAKAIKGTEISVFVGMAGRAAGHGDRHPAGRAGRLLRRQGGRLLEWLYNVFTAVPDILLIFAFAAVLGRGVGTVVLILALTGWTGLYRQVRAEFIKHSGREYVRAAEAIGASATSRMFRHILPNVSHVILVRMSLLVVGFIKSEVILSYLGLGVPIDQVSWGTMLAEAQGELILGHWWQLATATAVHGGVRHRVLADGRCAARCARPEAAGCRMTALLSASRTCRSPSAWASAAPSAVVPAVKGVSFDIPENTTRGAGGRIGLGQERHRDVDLNLLPDNAERSGRILWQGRDLLQPAWPTCRRCAASEIACVFQDPMSSLNPVFTVGAAAVRAAGQAPGLGRGRAGARRGAAGRGGHPRAEAPAGPTRTSCRAASSSA